MRPCFQLHLAAILCIAALQAVGDDLPPSATITRVGSGVTPPKLLHKQEPEYSGAALDAGVQGKVVFELVVSEAGKPANISVISPLGFGLDEKAQAAIETWRFEPGRKDGKPVNVLATIEVNFALQGRAYDRVAEERRTQFNIMLRELKEKNPARHEKAIKTMQALAKNKFPPAMYVAGKLMETGDGVQKDPAQGAALIRKAADKNYGPALFDVGLAQYEGKEEPRETDKGLHMIRDAAVLGSSQAQLFLGDRDERGVNTPVDMSRARRYFGLCAAAGQAVCELRLGKLLLKLPNRQEREYIQAAAWLQLAADQGEEEARTLIATEAVSLTPEQSNWVKRLKPQLVHRQ